MNEFQVRDSGQRAQFGSGMVRDITDGKPDYSLVFDGPMLERWAVHLTKGAQKYTFEWPVSVDTLHQLQHQCQCEKRPAIPVELPTVTRNAIRSQADYAAPVMRKDCAKQTLSTPSANARTPVNGSIETKPENGAWTPSTDTRDAPESYSLRDGDYPRQTRAITATSADVTPATEASRLTTTMTQARPAASSVSSAISHSDILRMTQSYLEGHSNTCSVRHYKMQGASIVRPGKRNWMLADGEVEMARFKESACRHFVQWMRGDTDEDHAAALYFNVCGHEYVRERMAEVMPDEGTIQPMVTEAVGQFGWTVPDDQKMGLRKAG